MPGPISFVGVCHGISEGYPKTKTSYGEERVVCILLEYFLVPNNFNVPS